MYSGKRSTLELANARNFYAIVSSMLMFQKKIHICVHFEYLQYLRTSRNIEKKQHSRNFNSMSALSNWQHIYRCFSGKISQVILVNFLYQSLRACTSFSSNRRLYIIIELKNRGVYLSSNIWQSYSNIYLLESMENEV